MLETQRDSSSLSSFKRNTPEFVRQLRETGRPILLTLNGEAALVVQDAAAYQKLLELVERLETLEGIRAGLEEMKAGNGRPAHEFFDEMEKNLKIPREP